MPTNWIVLTVAAVLAIGCQNEEEVARQQQAAARQTAWAEIEQVKQDLDARRAELASARAQAAQAPDDVAARAREAELDAGVTERQNDLSARLATYINDDPPLQGEAPRPDQLAAIRLNSAETMLIAREYIEMGGDYRKAIDIYNQLLVSDPGNADVKAALADAQAKRFMTEARFAAVKKGMTVDEVVAAIGRPYTRNIKEYPDRGVTTWLYPTDEKGSAAGVFFNDKKVVYRAEFAYAKPQGESAEAPAS
jgi:tetratricopeptide (TPR) repeat protein